MLNYFMTVRTHISYWRNITWETTLTPVVVVVTAASAVFGRCEGTWTPAKISKLWKVLILNRTTILFEVLNFKYNKKGKFTNW